MAINHLFDGVITEATHQGRVIKVETIHYHVPSDNAMIDSGVRTVASVWNGGRVETVGLTSGRDSNTWATGEVDADDETAQKAREYLSLVAWIGSLRGARLSYESEVQKSRVVQKGHLVEVIAGRKVKKGTRWHVYAAGKNSYGNYAHLSSQPNGLGDSVRFVNPDNLQILNAATPELTYPDCPFGPVTPDILACAVVLEEYLHLGGYSWAEKELDNRWRVLQDAWADSGFPVPDCVRRAAMREDS